MRGLEEGRMRAVHAVVFASVLGVGLSAAPAGAALPVDVAVEPWGDYGMRIDGTGGEGLGFCGLDFGDVNGDGYTDVVAATPSADTAGRTNNGGAVVVFGSATPGNVSTGALGERGFRILGSASGARASEYLRVTVAGDVNGDGYEDILISQSDYTAFLVLGAASAATVDLAAPNSRIVTLVAGEADSAALGSSSAVSAT